MSDLDALRAAHEPKRTYDKGNSAAGPDGFVVWCPTCHPWRCLVPAAFARIATLEAALRGCTCPPLSVALLRASLDDAALSIALSGADPLAHLDEFAAELHRAILDQSAPDAPRFPCCTNTHGMPVPCEHDDLDALRAPTTEAGKRLAAWSANDTPVQPDDWYGSILDIEDEAKRELARAKARIATLEAALSVERMSAAVHKALNHGYHGGGWDHGDGDIAHAILAALDQWTPDAP